MGITIEKAHGFDRDQRMIGMTTPGRLSPLIKHIRGTSSQSSENMKTL